MNRSTISLAHLRITLIAVGLMIAAFATAGCHFSESWSSSGGKSTSTYTASSDNGDGTSTSVTTKTVIENGVTTRTVTRKTSKTNQQGNVSTTVTKQDNIPLVQGNGVLKTETRTVAGSATRLSISNIGTVRVRQTDGGSLSVRVEAEETLLPLLTAKVENNTLILSMKDTSYSIHQPIVWDITMPHVDGLQADGASRITAQSIRTENLSVKVSGAASVSGEDVSANSTTVTITGAGVVTLTGSSRTSLNIDTSGAGQFKGAKYPSPTVTVYGSGAANMVVYAKDALTTRLSGASTVRYIGNPDKIDAQNSGASSTKKHG